jgi:hypothetical protein
MTRRSDIRTIAGWLKHPLPQRDTSEIRDVNGESVLANQALIHRIFHQ